MTAPASFPAEEAARAIPGWLAEDLGSGDRTAEATVTAGVRVRAEIVAKAAGVACGLPLVELVFGHLSRDVRVISRLSDGAPLRPGLVLAGLAGPARPILAGERTLLNLLGRLSGIATWTRRHVEALAGTRAVLADTRKTTPGLRRLEKYAVAVGGASNHRLGLDDAILVKENHLRAAGAKGHPERFREVVRAAVAAGGGARPGGGRPGVEVEIEVENLEELEWALEAGARAVLLDNLDTPTIARAVEIARARSPGVLLEASGGMTLERLRPVALAGVDRISMGALTHSAPNLDLSLEVVGPA